MRSWFRRRREWSIVIAIALPVVFVAFEGTLRGQFPPGGVRPPGIPGQPGSGSVFPPPFPGQPPKFAPSGFPGKPPGMIQPGVPGRPGILGQPGFPGNPGQGGILGRPNQGIQPGQPGFPFGQPGAQMPGFGGMPNFPQPGNNAGMNPPGFNPPQPGNNPNVPDPEIRNAEMNPPVMQFQPQQVFDQIWTCSRCGAELGRGGTQPAVYACPHCGARLSGPWTAIGVGAGVVVVLLLILLKLVLNAYS
jgi:hypothetical protein